jgi:hypothetical protein
MTALLAGVVLGFLFSVFFLLPNALSGYVGNEQNREVMMKDNLLRIVSVAAVILVFSLGNTAFAGHDNENKFTGVIESLPNAAGFVGDWRVAGRTVHVTSSTRIEQTDGQVALGATVKVEGTTRADNSVDAASIEVKEGESGGGGGSDDSAQPTFKGTIEILSTAAGSIGDLRVGGRTIHVSAATRIETEFGPIAVGAFVEIHGTVRADGSMDATKIETKSNVAGGDGRDELKGTIEALPSSGLIGDWRVSNRTVHVTADTIINQEHGAAAVGASVEVAGTQRADGSIDATRIEVQPSSRDSSGEGQSANVKGAIQSLPPSGLVGDWTVGGRLVHVVSSTKLSAEHGAFVIGARVKVKGLQMADGSVVATKVQLRDSN